MIPLVVVSVGGSSEGNHQNAKTSVTLGSGGSSEGTPASKEPLPHGWRAQLTCTRSTSGTPSTPDVNDDEDDDGLDNDDHETYWYYSTLHGFNLCGAQGPCDRYDDGISM